MISYTGSRNLYGTLTNNSSTTNLATGDSLINAETRRILRKLGSKILERTYTDTTETSVQYYPKPARMKKLKTVAATVGTTKYTIKLSPSREHWDRLNQVTGYTSSIPEWYYPRANDIGFWPIPSGTAVTLTFVFDILQKDLTLADYTTGTILTATNGTTLIVGASTGWTDQMAGRFLKVTEANGDNTGDGEWYEISSSPSSTTVILQRNYEGNSISVGTATYTIGQVSMIPDGYHELPIYHAVATYYNKNDQNRYTYFKAKADAMEAELFADAGSDTMDVSITDTDDSQTINPNLQVQL